MRKTPNPQKSIIPLGCLGAAINAACEAVGCDPWGVVSKSRIHSFALARHIAMYLLYDQGRGWRLTDIAKRTDYHHTTVFHALEKMARIVRTNKSDAAYVIRAELIYNGSAVPEERKRRISSERVIAAVCKTMGIEYEDFKDISIGNSGNSRRCMARYIAAYLIRTNVVYKNRRGNDIEATFEHIKKAVGWKGDGQSLIAYRAVETWQQNHDERWQHVEAANSLIHSAEPLPSVMKPLRKKKIVKIENFNGKMIMCEACNAMGCTPYPGTAENPAKLCKRCNGRGEYSPRIRFNMEVPA